MNAHMLSLLPLCLACGTMAAADRVLFDFESGTFSEVGAQTAAEVLKVTGVTHGLAIHVGCTDGALVSDLANTGKMLAHGLALDPATRENAINAVVAEGTIGLATVEQWSGAPELPFAENTASLLIADLDLLQDAAPTGQEILRVLEPNGVAYLKTSGRWQTTVKSWPAGLDDWTHWCYGPEGNAVSRDTAVGPSTSLKWIAGVQGQDLRITRGLLFSPLRPAKTRGLPEATELVGRDAFNGVPLWRATTGSVKGDRPQQLVASEGLVFHFPKRSPCFAVATDARTGRTVREFSEGLRWPIPPPAQKGFSPPAVVVQLVCGSTLIQGYGREVVALDLPTGTRRWRVELERDLGAMVATPDGRRVFVHEVEDAGRGWARWGKHQTVAITGLLDGQVAWRNPGLAGEEISDLIHDAGALYAFDPTTNLGDDGDADLWKFAPDTGKLLWAKKGPKHNYNVFLNNAVVRGADIVSWGSFNNLRSYNVIDGTERNHTINGYNQRCTRMSATRNWLVFGLTTWVDRDFNWTQMAVGRSDCAYPAFLAHGQTFFTYNLACSCINPLRGIVALVPEEPAAAWPDARRKQDLSRAANSRAASARERSGPVSTRSVQPLLDGRGSAGPTNVIRAEWTPDPLLFYRLDDTTPPIEHDGMTLVAKVHRHTLTASRGDEIVWRFVPGGRIYGAPLIHESRCYVASADGWLYCLDAATGSPHWRFLAAPRECKVVAYGQLESSWPVYNVVLHGGAVCVAAGRHAELDGGIFLWGLDPATGEMRWKTAFHTPATRYAAGSKALRGDRTLMREVASVTPLNGGLASDDGRLYLVSPVLKKSGSSNSQWGYFENPPNQPRGALQFRRIEVRIAEWNGQTINPQDLVPLTAKKK